MINYREDIGWRLEAANALARVAALLDRCIEEAAMTSGGELERSAVASIGVEALEEAATTFGALRDLLHQRGRGHDVNSPTTSLDVLLRKVRLNALDRLYTTIAGVKFEAHNADDLNDSTITRLAEIAARLRALAVDAQLSIPDVFVHMLVDGRCVGVARLAAADLYYSPTSRLRRGAACGILRATPLAWPTIGAAKFRVSL